MNRGARTFHFVLVKVEFIDPMGRVVGVLMTDARRDVYVLPGGTRSFDVRRNGRLDYATVRASVVSFVEAR